MRTPTSSCRVRDNLVLMEDGSLAELTEDGPPMTGHRVLTSPFDADLGVALPWECALVWRYEGLDLSSIVVIDRDRVIGKAMLCRGILTGWLKDWFQSKRSD